MTGWRAWRRARLARLLAAATLATAWLVGRSAGAAPTPSDVEEARKHYSRGVELYEEHADSSALSELERAYQLAPNWKVLYELGVVELAVHDFAAALSRFEQYLDEGKDGVKAQRRQEVTTQIAQLRQLVATIEPVTEPGAVIRLDDVPVATAPLARPLVVNPGHHMLGASKDGRFAESRAISVAGGDRTRVELVIPEPAPAPPPAPQVVVPAPAPPPPGVTPPQPPAPREEIATRPPYPLWFGFAATGALATGALITGLEALGANSSLTQAKAEGPATSATLSSLSSRAHAFALASDVMTGVAVAAGGVTLYFALRSPLRATPAGASTSPTATSPSIRLGLGRVSIEGSF